MDLVRPSDFLKDQVPARHQVLLPTVLKQAYDAVQIIVANEPILQTPNAQDNKGRLVSWAVDHGVVKLIESGRWPVRYRWSVYGHVDQNTERFSQTGRYLEILLSHSTMTISQVADPTKQPRDAKFRENARLINDPFIPELEMDEDRAVNGLPSFLFVHGYQELRFAHLCVPHARHHRRYIYRTGNLLLLPHEVPSDTAPVENTDVEATMTLKEEIDKWRKDHGG